MNEPQSNEISTEGEVSSDSTMGNDVLLVESSAAQVVVVDDDDRIPQEKYDSPLLKIQFNSGELYRTLLLELSTAIQTVFQIHLPEQCVELRPCPDERTIEVFETNTRAPPEDSLFIIDATPTKSRKDHGPIPSYKKVMTKVYQGQTPGTTPNCLAKRPRVQQTCWNCEGDHGLKDCKELRNYTRIRQKKEEFQKKTDRYHADMEQNYGHLVAGKLTRELRDALGLGSRDLPLHIYKMRMFGYPPGWLEDAKVTHSGLQLFDSNGDVVNHNSDGSDGDVDHARSKYDVRKIIAFPGFNEMPPPKMFDDSKFYNAPPYSEELSREKMIRQLEGTLVHGYRRKKLKLLGEESGVANSVDSSANMELIDMDPIENSPKRENPQQEEGELEDEELSKDMQRSPLPTVAADESVILIETPVEVITLDETVINKSRSASPTTLGDLEQGQQELDEQLSNQSTDTTIDSSFMKDILLVDELGAANDQPMPPPPPPTFSNVAGPPLPKNTILPDEPFIPPPPPPPDGLDDSNPSAKPPEPETLDLGEIAMNKVPYLDDPGSVGLKKMSLGTPILRAFTPYNLLPSGEAFSKGVSDVINFENLPNSTGKYEKMKSILLQVRQKISDHMHDTDERK